MNNHGLDLHCEMMLEEYRENLHTFHKMKEIVDKQIRHCLRSNKIKVNAVESRIKTEKSLIGKLERKGHKYRMLSDITDILGARIITFYTDEVDKVSALIDNIFEIDWEESVDKLRHRMAAVFVLVAVHIAAPFNLYNHVGGESIDDRGADAVQTAGNLVDGVAELAARMQNRVDHARGRNLLRRMNVHRDTAAVVNDGDAAVLLKRDVDFGAISCEVLVDTVVENFPYKVVKTFAARRADVHTGPLADGFKPFQNDNLTAIVFCHADTFLTVSALHAKNAVTTAILYAVTTAILCLRPYYNTTFWYRTQCFLAQGAAGGIARELQPDFLSREVECAAASVYMWTGIHVEDGRKLLTFPPVFGILNSSKKISKGIPLRECGIGRYLQKHETEEYSYEQWF